MNVIIQNKELLLLIGWDAQKMGHHNELNELLEDTQLSIYELHDEKLIGELYGELHYYYKNLELPEERCSSTKLEIIRDYKIETIGIEKIFSLADDYIAKFKRFTSPTFSYTRPMIGYIRSSYRNKNDLVGCEIGVGRGHNAKNILTKLNCKKLYLIDPYLPYIENGKSMILVKLLMLPRKLYQNLMKT